MKLDIEVQISVIIYTEFKEYWESSSHGSKVVK